MEKTALEIQHQRVFAQLEARWPRLAGAVASVRGDGGVLARERRDDRERVIVPPPDEVPTATRAIPLLARGAGDEEP